MRLRTIALTALILAACGRNETPTANEKQPAPAPAAIEPGLYRQATTLLEFKDPSLKGDEATAAAKAIGTTQTADRCVTPEMIDNPKAIVLSGAEQGCKVDKSVWEGGKIDLALTCPEDEQTRGGSMSLTGTYDRDHYSLDMVMRGGPDEVTRMKVGAKRLGDCQK